MTQKDLATVWDYLSLEFIYLSPCICLVMSKVHVLLPVFDNVCVFLVENQREAAGCKRLRGGSSHSEPTDPQQDRAHTW